MLKKFKKTLRDYDWHMCKYETNIEKKYINKFSYPLDVDYLLSYSNNSPIIWERYKDVFKFEMWNIFVSNFKTFPDDIKTSIIFGKNTLLPSKELPRFTIIKNTFVSGDGILAFLWITSYCNIIKLLQNNN